MQPTQAKTAQVAARCSKGLKKRIKDAIRSTGRKESDIVRVALIRFFEANKTPELIAQAVSMARSEEAA